MAFGGRAPPGPAIGELTALPQIPIRGRRSGKGRGRNEGKRQGISKGRGGEREEKIGR